MGRTPRRRALSAIADLLDDHLDPTDPLAGYPALLRSVRAPALEGYLTGSLDAVLRVRRAEIRGGGLQNEPAFHRGYRRGPVRPPAMAAAMLREHYPLQALLYLVALHRYLRWRQPGYLPETHLGGVMYLFLRAHGRRLDPTWMRCVQLDSACAADRGVVGSVGGPMMSLISVRPEFREYQEAGVLSVADVHTCVRLGRLGGETDERVLLAAALTVRALRHGSVCLELDRLPELFAEATAEASHEGHAVGCRDCRGRTPDDLIAARARQPAGHRRRARWAAAVETDRHPCW